MIFEVTILGCGAAAPTSKHNPSSQVLNIHDKLFLMDCGEGTQMQLRRFKVRFQRINEVFISHLHGDHYLGLMGFISSMHLLGRKSKLTVFGPPELKDILDIQLRASQTFLEYPLEFVAVQFDEKKLIFEDKSVCIYSFPLKHRIDCCGYIFVEKQRKPRISKEKIAELALEPSHIVALKNDQHVTLPDGRVLDPLVICEPPLPPRSYAYCSDTAYSEKVAHAVAGVNLLYHESTFLESERERAKATFHSTAKQAAQIANMANAQGLLLGHFSSRYVDDEEFAREAKTVFPHVHVANEGKTFAVRYRE